VDLVGLPDKQNPEETIIKPKVETPPRKQQQEQKQAETAKLQTTAKTSVTKAPDVKKELAKEQSSAINRLKALSAIEKLKQEEQTPSQQIKGNVISPGTALRGLNKLQFDEYISSIDLHVKSNWALPEWMLHHQFRAEVLVRIDSNGNLIERKFLKKSGNGDFDQRVWSAIEKSLPFPAPPSQFVDLVGVQGITFAFPE
jgi:colicin import membrane protein